MLVSFVGGDVGTWEVERISAVRGAGLPSVARVDVVEGWGAEVPDGAAWILRGVTSSERYVTRAEQETLRLSQPPLGRPQATVAAVIPVRAPLERDRRTL